MRITLGMVCRNEEHRIADSILSARRFVDEVFVIDQESTDRTAYIAKELGAHVIYTQPLGYADPDRPLLLEHCTTPWMLMLDADEILTDQIGQALHEMSEHTRGAWLKRRTTFGGQPWRDEWCYRFFPVDNVNMPTGLHQPPSPKDDHRVVKIEAVGIEHHKTWREQLEDDVRYEQLGQVDPPFLKLARELGLEIHEIDEIPVEERIEMGFHA